MSSMWGRFLRISIFGESHGESIGVSIDGFPAGEKIDFDALYTQIKRRFPNDSKISTSRREKDKPEFISGILNGMTTGSPICAIIKNIDKNSEDYKGITNKLRPGHADYTGKVRYKGYNDSRGGGHFSGRLTAPLTVAGALCKQFLSRRDINVCGHIYSISNIEDKPFDPINVEESLAKRLQLQSFPLIDKGKEASMRSLIEGMKLSMDSVGGTVECAVTGLRPGVGSPMFYGVENAISSIIFGIPAVKGIEFGNGFECTCLRGSQNNDPFTIDNGKIKTTSNNHGGVLGGISSGMPIIFRVAIKPTPSIAKTQSTVDINKNVPDEISVMGRHDPCIVPRAVTVVEAAAAIAITDLILEGDGYEY